ncbi:hypothetical protein VSQ82_08825 [Pseudomonas sp. MS-1(2024)]|uniref:hypothetical protein n=1 Tax=Pseudomonas sp. MS-1(2024) TaxID=3112251 RepID=UPI002DBABF3C|nr:hypothetical protein [Pseudomonas sp. MS-1(2024)]MEC4167344.1 hypothetical protein [Pseudomonas sp. MS-1(2024)]
MSLLDFLNAKQYVGAAKIYVAPNIPKKLLSNALTSYGLTVDPAEIVILIDDTVFGSGKDGCLIGLKHLGIKEIFTDSVAYAFDEIDMIEVKGNKLFLDDEKVISFNVPDKKDIKECFELIDEWLSTNSSEAPASRVSSPVLLASADAEELHSTEVQVVLQKILAAAERMGLERVYVQPHIPQKKLQAALGSYGSNMTEDDVLVLIDDTLFGSAKEGLLIGKNTLALKMLFDTPRIFFWKHMISVAVEKRDFYVNSRKIGSLTQLSDKELMAFCSVINSALGEARSLRGGEPGGLSLAVSHSPRASQGAVAVVEAPSVELEKNVAVVSEKDTAKVVFADSTLVETDAPSVQKTSAKDKLFDYISSTIEQNKSKILPYLKEKTGEASLTALRNDENVEKLAGVIYALLPGVVRLALREQVFVQFVLVNRNKILDRLVQGEIESTASVASRTPVLSVEADLDGALNSLLVEKTTPNDDSGAVVIAQLEEVLKELKKEMAEDLDAALFLQMPISCLDALVKRAQKLAKHPKAEVEVLIFPVLAFMYGFSFHKIPEEIREQEELFKAFFIGLLMIYGKYEERDVTVAVDADAECMPLAYTIAKVATKEQLNAVVRGMLEEQKNNKGQCGFDVDDIMLLLRDANSFAVQWVNVITRQALQEERELQGGCRS